MGLLSLDLVRDLIRLPSPLRMPASAWPPVWSLLRLPWLLIAWLRYPPLVPATATGALRYLPVGAQGPIGISGPISHSRIRSCSAFILPELPVRILSPLSMPTTAIPSAHPLPLRIRPPYKSISAPFRVLPALMAPAMVRPRPWLSTAMAVRAHSSSTGHQVPSLPGSAPPV